MSNAQILAKVVSSTGLLADGELNGLVTVPQGGTGSATLTTNSVVLGNGTNPVQTVAPGTAGNILTSNGTTWVSQANSSQGVTTYSYDARGDLRSLAGTTGKQAIVQGLGLFVYQENSDEPDDDETCFANGTGRWLVEAAHFDLVDAWQMVEDDARDSFDEDEYSRFLANYDTRVLYGTATCAITSVGTLNIVSFTGTVTGASVGDRVVVNPPGIIDAAPAPYGLTYYALVSAVDTVTIHVLNASASSRAVSQQVRDTPWVIAVFKEI